jgi:integrase
MERKELEVKRRHRANGEGSLYQRADGYWVGSYYRRDGKRAVVYGRTKVEADAALTKAKAAKLNNEEASTDRVKVGAFLTSWLDGARDRGSIRPTTAKNYESYVRLHILPDPISNKKLVDLTSRDVQQCMDRLKRKLSPHAVGYTRTVLRAGLKFAVRQHIIRYNPATNVELPKAPKTLPRQPFTQEQVDVLLKGTDRGGEHVPGIQTHRLFALWLTELMLGVRPSEALGLRWPDELGVDVTDEAAVAEAGCIDLDRGIIHLRNGLQRLEGEWSLAPLKTEDSRRDLDIPPILFDALQKLRDSQSLEYKRATKLKVWAPPIAGLAFRTETGAPVHATRALQEFQKELRRLGLPKRPCYTLRHTFTTWLLESGEHNEFEVAKLLGHTTATLVHTTYGHLTKRIRERGAATMQARLTGAK